MATAGNPAERLAYEGKVRHFWVETLTNPAAPSVAELTAGFDFTRYVPKDGVSGDPVENFIDSTDISETFDAQQVGSWGEQITFQMYKQYPNDDAFDFWAYGDVGYFVSLWAADADSPKDGDPCYVRHLEVHQPKPLPHSPNAKQRFTMASTNIEEPIYTATVGGGGS